METTCTFFGRRDCPANVRGKLRDMLVKLIECRGVERPYGGAARFASKAVRQHKTVINLGE